MNVRIALISMRVQHFFFHYLTIWETSTIRRNNRIEKRGENVLLLIDT
jgi:hypothetical protein